MKTQARRLGADVAWAAERVSSQGNAIVTPRPWRNFLREVIYLELTLAQALFDSQLAEWERKNGLRVRTYRPISGMSQKPKALLLKFPRHEL